MGTISRVHHEETELMMSHAALVGNAGELSVHNINENSGTTVQYLVAESYL